MKKYQPYLNLGGGQTEIADSFNIDINPRSHKDLQWDLNKFPYPIPDNTFEGAYCHHILEHVDEPLRVLQEIWRILKPGGFAEVISPHYSSVNAYTDPTHQHFFGLRSLLYLTGENQWSYYMEGPLYSEESATLTWPKRFGGGLLHSFFMAHPLFYEEKMAWIFPAENVVIRLKARKESDKK